ncbi:30S ribosomal protein S16 [Candidatus Saccharibacteria bacterium]|nr:30S ribosomal protein S16 [Candidatus Saccharibacteria bacterium]
MVSIRLQRTGRRRHAQFRVVVQDSRRAPTSGRVIANLGFYNPHTKEHGVDLEKAAVYLQNGAQPSERMVKFFMDHKVDLPAWVERPKQKAKSIRHPDKLRRNRPPEAAAEEAAPPAEAEAETAETPAEPESETAGGETAEADDGQASAETAAEEKEEKEEKATGDSEAGDDKPATAEEEETTEEDGGGGESEEEETEQQADAK